MPRPSAHTPTRRLLLQAVLLFILVGTVGLAKVVTNYKLHAARVKLSAPVRFDDMAVALPAKWKVEFPPHTAGPQILRAAEPPADGLPGRVLTVLRDHTDIPLPPAEYLLTSGIMPPAYAVSLGGVGQLLPPSTAPVAGQPGYVVAGIRPIRINTGQVVIKKEVFATAMLPGSRDVISVRLEGLGREVDDDLALVRAVAAAVAPHSPPASPAAADIVALPNGVTAKPPPGFVPLPESDPHLTERHLVRAAPPSRWSSVTLVPCVFLPDGGDDQETFRTMLMARDAEWFDAKIAVAADKSTLRADLPLRAGLPFPRRAYLHTSPSGHALMVELHAGSTAEAADWDALFEQVVASATAPTDAAPAELLKAGVAEVDRLRGITLPSLLAGVPTDQWWLWSLRGRPVGWTHFAFAAGDPSQGTLDDRLRAAGGAAVAVRHAFETSPDFSRHKDATLRRDVDPGGNVADRFREDTSLADGRYALALMPNPSAGGQVARTVRPAPPAFLPGPWLRVLTPKLARREMVLRTTQCPGLEGIVATAPLTVRLRPTTRPATFDVDVSGTGQVITISPDGIELSATAARHPSNPDEIQKAFPEEAALSPNPAPRPQ